jgi:hypothetical protein
MVEMLIGVYRTAAILTELPFGESVGPWLGPPTVGGDRQPHNGRSDTLPGGVCPQS